MAFRFDIDPDTLERNRRNWQRYHKLGIGDGTTIILNEDGSHSAIAGQDSVPPLMPIPRVWYHDDFKAADDPTLGDPELPRSITHHPEGLISQYVVQGEVLFDSLPVITGNTTYIYSDGTIFYGSDADGHGADGNWQDPATGWNCISANQGGAEQELRLTPIIRCWTLAFHTGPFLTTGLFFYKDHGKSPVGIFKFGWFSNGTSQREWTTRGAWPTTLEVVEP